MRPIGLTGLVAWARKRFEGRDAQFSTLTVAFGTTLQEVNERAGFRW
jgi:hypothetical protein